MKTLRVALPIAALLAAAVLAPSAGAAGWVTGQPLSPPDRQAIDPQVGVTPSGERIAVWRQLKPGTNFDEEGIAVRIAPPGGDFGPVQLLGDGSASQPELATGADDNVALAWLDGGKLHIARRPPGASSFTDAAPLPVDPDSRSQLHVAVQGGDVYVAYATSGSIGNDEITSIRAAHLDAGTTNIQPLAGAGPGGVLDSARFTFMAQPAHSVDDPSIAVGAGAVHVAWEDVADAATVGQSGVTTVRRASRPVGGGDFGAPVAVGSSRAGSFRADESSPRVAASGNEVRFAWSDGLGNAIKARGIAADAPVQSILTPGFAFNIHAGVDPSGTLVLGWDQVVNTETAFAVFGAQLPAAAAMGTAQRLTQPDANSTLDDFAVGPDGSALAVPDHRNDNVRNSAVTLVQGAVATPGNPFGSLEDVSGPKERVGNGAFDTAAAAVGADGRAIVGWTADDHSGTAGDRFFLSERDATPPTISNVAVPATAQPGAPIALAAEATDAQSPVVLSWDFGDGSHARGGLVSHTYGAAGSYTLSVTARDGAGNVSTESRTLVVATPKPGADRTPPRITRLKSARARFRAGVRTGGTTFTLEVDERSTLVVSFKRKAGPRRIALPAVLIRTRSGPGAVAIPFGGSVGGARLKPGSYVASVTAIDGAGNRSLPATVSFKVVPR
jgi:PKD repeat protein